MPSQLLLTIRERAPPGLNRGWRTPDPSPTPASEGLPHCGVLNAFEVPCGDARGSSPDRFERAVTADVCTDAVPPKQGRPASCPQLLDLRIDDHGLMKASAPRGRDQKARGAPRRGALGILHGDCSTSAADAPPTRTPSRTPSGTHEDVPPARAPDAAWPTRTPSPEARVWAPHTPPAWPQEPSGALREPSAGPPPPPPAPVAAAAPCSRAPAEAPSPCNRAPAEEQRPAAARKKWADTLDCMGTMRDQLRQLGDVDQSCVILARKIQYLGFSASTQIEQHFKAFGPVQDVVVPQSHVKPVRPAGSPGSPSESSDRAETVRQRPANLAFVVMETAAGAQAALAAGTEQVIGGANVVLEPYDGTRWKQHGAALGAAKRTPRPARVEDGEEADPCDESGWKHPKAALVC